VEESFETHPRDRRELVRVRQSSSPSGGVGAGAAKGSRRQPTGNRIRDFRELEDEMRIHDHPIEQDSSIPMVLSLRG
jgi:hypothetical protein